MARLVTKTEYLEIKHPNFPEVVVKVRKLEPIEAMDIFSGFQKFQKVIVLVHPSTGEILKDNDGEILTRTLTNLPSSALMDILGNVIENVSGLEDEEGKTIPIPPKENIKYLFKKELFVNKTQSFADYIQAQINEDVNDKENDPDSKKTTSLKPA